MLNIQYKYLKRYKEMKRGLLAVLILAILGVSGFVSWNFLQNKPDKKSTNTHQTNDDPSEGGKYLVIKEWGVRVPKSSNTQDLIYYYNPARPNGIINFGLIALAARYPGCAPDRVGLSLGLVRSTEEDSLSPLESFTKIGDYFYAVGSGGATCFDSLNIPESDVALSGLAREELSEALKKLEKY